MNIDSFNKLHISLKWLISGLGLLMPFWFITIYILKPALINNQVIFISIILAFCLSVIVYGSSLFTAMVIDSFKRGVDNKDSFFFFSTGLILSLFFICITAYIGYYKNLSLKQVINISCWSSVGLGVFSFFTLLIKLRNRK